MKKKEKTLKFKNETERLRYAQKLAKEKLDSLTPEMQLRWGRAHLLISLEREILDKLPLSGPRRKP